MLIRLVKREGARILTVPEPLVVHLAEHDRPSLSQRYPWQQSLAWLDALGDLITPRAYSGFCLTILAPQPARYGQYGAFWPLLSLAFTRGSTTVRQLAIVVAVRRGPWATRHAIQQHAL